MEGPKPDNHKTVKGSKPPSNEQLIATPLNRNFLTIPFQMNVERIIPKNCMSRKLPISVGVNTNRVF